MTDLTTQSRPGVTSASNEWGAPAKVAGRLARLATIVAYGALGATLVVTRIVGLDRSLWHDEIVTVRDFIQEGPGEILAGSLLNHELFGLLAWATSLGFGESEVTMRVWSVLPFVLGVAFVTAWAHVRLGAMTGLLFLFLATCSPALLDVSRQARGYGLAFLAMGVLVVTAFEAERAPRRSMIIGFCAAGVAGTFTLPHFGIAFVAMGLLLAVNRALRRWALVGVGASTALVAALYAPHVGAAKEASSEEYDTWINVTGLPTAPFDQVLLPAILRLDGTPPIGTVAWLPFLALVLVPIAASPLLRERRAALLLCLPVLTTIVALWATGTYVVPRYLNYLLVPLFLLLASGAATILGRLGNPAWIRSVVVVTVLALVGVVFADSASRVLRLPREAHKDAAQAIAATASSVPVFAYMREPEDLAYYVDRPLTAIRQPRAVPQLCERSGEFVLVVHAWRIPDVEIPCASRATRLRLEQYARGEHIDVWFVRPS